MKKVLGLLLVGVMGFGGLQGATAESKKIKQSIASVRRAILSNLDKDYSVKLQNLAERATIPVEYDYSTQIGQIRGAHKEDRLRFYLTVKFAEKIPNISIKEDAATTQFVGEVKEKHGDDTNQIDAILEKAFPAHPEHAPKPGNGKKLRVMVGIGGMGLGLIAGTLLYKARDYFRYRLLGRSVAPEKAPAIYARIEQEVEGEFPDAPDEELVPEIKQRLLNTYGEHNLKVFFPKDVTEKTVED